METSPLASLHKAKRIVTSRIISPIGFSKVSCRIKSDGIPGGEFRLEDSDGNLINLPISSVTWTMEEKGFARATLELVNVEIDAMFDPETSVVISSDKKKRKSVNLIEFLKTHGKDET